MADRFEQWSRARLGEYVQRDGETFATVIVPVDGEQHDPRADVLHAIVEQREGIHQRIGETDARVMGDLQPSVEAEKPVTTRHRKTRGK